MVRRLLALLFLTLLAGPALAQTTTGVRGTVRAEGSNLPLSGVRVLTGDTTTDTRTAHDGTYVITVVLPATVIFVRDGYATFTEQVTAGTGITLDVALTPAPSITQEVTVLGRVSDYTDATAGAARTSARLIEVPQAIQVLPGRLLEDIGALDTKDLYRHIAGVTDSTYSATVVRGFTQREVLVNGLRGNPYGSLEGDVNNLGFSTSQFRLTNVERVEVLKGPASVLYGSSEPGGILNYVTKKPRGVFEARATLGTGQWSQGLADVEVTGPATASGSVLYRGALYFEDRDHFRNNAATRNAHGVANLLWQARPGTTIAAEYELIDQRNDAHRLRGVPVTATGTFLADYRWSSNEPTDFTDLRAHVGQLRLDQSLARGARLDATVRRLAYDRSEQYHEPRGITNNGTLMQREFRDQLRRNDDWSASLNVSLPVATGTVRHDIAVGADVLRQDLTFRSARARQANAGGPVPALALINPVYGLGRPSAYGLTAASFATETAQATRTGVYAQNLLTLNERWNLLAGGRLDRYDDEGRSGGLDLAVARTAATGRLGLVFKVLPTLSLYGNVANGFTRPSVLAQHPSANGPHDPETSRQFEAGLKTDLIAGRLALTSAVFTITKRNVLRPDPAFGPTGVNFNAVLATGEVRARGLEVDLAGALLPQWHIAANYAWLNSEITRDVTASLVGQKTPNAAPHKVGLFTRVDLPRGAAVAGSLEYAADRVEPFAGIVAPAFTVADLHYFQQLTTRARLQVRLENVFDTQYASSALFAARAGNIPGQPRTLSVSLTFSSTPGLRGLFR